MQVFESNFDSFFGDLSTSDVQAFDRLAYSTDTQSFNPCISDFRTEIHIELSKIY
jgi:hypothetical protein